MTEKVLIEVCVDSVASAIAAESGGADRLELCSALIEGGITPSAGLIQEVRTRVSLPLYVMIRPRGGDFLYDGDEFEVMKRDIVHARKSGANGIALGLLEVNGKVDVARTRELIELAKPMGATFHRAFDMAADLSRALDDVCLTGAERVLTSGGRQTAAEGAVAVASIVQAARGRIAVMAGAGIKPENARALVEKTGLREIHVGLRLARSSEMKFRNEHVSMGSVKGREYEGYAVLEESVRALRRAISS